MDVYDFIENMVDDKEFISIYDMNDNSYFCRGLRSEFVRNKYVTNLLYEIINNITIDSKYMCIQINI